ncbi:MAG: hypothetical protein J3R72DRAFT_501519 [Linnemannia gamsii]|nr:MAG: hypothetical protein J3R72DRAFT_501519 [Linnemannia gamsii]
MIASTKLFDIFELTTLITNNLSQHDLAACCLVNHSWFNTFTPYLWHTITIQLHDPLPAKFTTPEGRAGLARNGHHVRVLHTHSLESLGLFLENVSGGGSGVGGAVGGAGVFCKSLVVLDTEYGLGASSFRLRSGAMLSKERHGKGLFEAAITTDKQRQAVAESKTFQDAEEERARAEQDYEPEDLERARSAELDPSLATYRPLVGFVDMRTMTAELRTKYAERKIRERARLIARVRREAEARQILIRVLDQNPRLEFLILPPHCLQSEAVVKVAVEGLPLLRELYSSSTMSVLDYPEKFLLTDHRRWPSTVARKYLEGYPRLKELELNVVKSINHAELEKLKTVSNVDLTCLEIQSGHAAGIMQMLCEVPGGLLKSIVLTYLRIYFLPDEPREKVGQSVFLKHASTLEHLFARGCAIESKDIGDLLCASPRLKTIEMLREDMGTCEDVDHGLELQDAIKAPWMCDGLEVFECKISDVPRPDLSYDFFYFERSWAPYPAIPPCPEGPAVELISPQRIIQQQSHALQRKFLKQLGKLHRLRILAFGSDNPAYERTDSFALILKGIRTMIVAEDVQHQCLELTLESGLDELSSLKELEELNIYRMAHRIGVEEIFSCSRRRKSIITPSLFSTINASTSPPQGV